MKDESLTIYEKEQNECAFSFVFGGLRIVTERIALLFFFKITSPHYYDVYSEDKEFF